MVKRFLQGLQKQAAVLRACDGIFSVEYKTRNTAHAQLLRVIDVFPHKVHQRAVVEDVFEVMDVEADVGAELQQGRDVVYVFTFGKIGAEKRFLCLRLFALLSSEVREAMRLHGVGHHDIIELIGESVFGCHLCHLRVHLLCLFGAEPFVSGEKFVYAESGLCDEIR